MSDIAIRVENLGKRYSIGGPRAQYENMREAVAQIALAPWRRLRHLGQQRPTEETIWALKDVSFEVNRGDVMGIIGRNGAGKTTLLKILSRITDPSEGYAQIQGRVGSLLEVGTGFHPELTGRENIHLSGAILGMKRQEIERRFDEIVAFSEIEKFLDTPIKRYSSGMYVRLAFAVAAHLEPDILLVDEVLAVGDAAFQKKCLGKMGDVAREGRTVLFVSHNMAAIENLCQRGVVLENGRVEYMGDQVEAIGVYLTSVRSIGTPIRERTDRRGTGDVRVVTIELRDTRGNAIDTIASGQDVDIYLHFETTQRFHRRGLSVGLVFRTRLDVPVFQINNILTGNEFGQLPESGAFVCRLKRLPLPRSTYRVTYSVSAGGEYLDGIADALELTVVEGDFFGTGRLPPISHGVCLVDGQWDVVPSASSQSVSQLAPRNREIRSLDQ